MVKYISSSLNTRQDTLQIKPSLIRDVTISGHKFTKQVANQKLVYKRTINYLTPEEDQLGDRLFSLLSNY